MLSSDSETLASNKILILYILNKIGKPISANSLLNIVLTLTDINYFYLQQFLLDLLEKKYISIDNKDDGIFYNITKDGKETLSLTQDIVPGITKLKVDANFKNELETFDNTHSIISEYTPVSENNYTVTCKIVDSGENVFEIKTFAGSRDQAKQIVDNWNKNADKMYPGILEILTKDKDKNINKDKKNK